MSELENTLLTLITRTAETRPEAVALRMFGDESVREMTYATLCTMIDEWAHTFEQAGIRPGDRVALLGENSPEWIVALLTLFRMTATVPRPDDLDPDIGATSYSPPGQRLTPRE